MVNVALSVSAHCCHSVAGTAMQQHAHCHLVASARLSDRLLLPNQCGQHMGVSGTCPSRQELTLASQGPPDFISDVQQSQTFTQADM